MWRGLKLMLCVRRASKIICFGAGMCHVAGPEIDALREAFIQNHMFRTVMGHVAVPVLGVLREAFINATCFRTGTGHVAGPEIGVPRAAFIKK